MKSPEFNGCEDGLTLIELMIALLIGTLLIGGVFQVFSGTRAASRLSEGLARVQENGRFAMDYLQRDIRIVGHFGCVNDQALVRKTPSQLQTTFGAAAHPSLDFGVSIQGYEAAGTAPDAVNVSLSSGAAAANGFQPALPAEYKAAMDNAVAGSDVIVMRYLAPEGVPLTVTPADPANPVLQFDASRWDVLRSGVNNPGVFGVADCTGTTIFQAQSVVPGTGTITVGAAPNNATSVAQVFTSGQATVYRAESIAYYVGTNASGGRSLYRLRFSYVPNSNNPVANKEELVEGVENMQLLYGQDRELDPAEPPTGYIDRQYTAAQVESNKVATVADAWRRVGAVQLGLVVSSPDKASAEQASDIHKLNALGVTFIAPDDGRFRSVYQNTVALRNRLYGN